MRDRIKRLPPNMRLRDLGATCKAHRDFSEAVEYASAYVLQSVWLFRQYKLGIATRHQDRQLQGSTDTPADPLAVDPLAVDPLAVNPRHLPVAGSQRQSSMHHSSHHGPAVHVQLPEGGGGGVPEGRAHGSHSGGQTPQALSRSSSRAPNRARNVSRRISTRDLVAAVQAAGGQGLGGQAHSSQG